tara:strand:+ start:667 stop:945 length:279 start_codon:yes stop_codon:yes gene_type:complete
MSQTVICIPRISVDIDKNYIINKIKTLNWGLIEWINEIPLFKEPQQKRIIIKLKWNKNDKTVYYKKFLETGNTVKFVYEKDAPWFWRINKFN